MGKVVPVGCFDHIVLPVRSDPVLRAKERGQSCAGISKNFCCVLKMPVDGSLVTDETDALTGQLPRRPE